MSAEPRNTPEAVEPEGLVKKLEWLNDMVFSGQPHSYAETPLGPWTATAYAGRGGRWAYDDPVGDMSDLDWATRDEAQSAAQADYTARILAALDLSALQAQKEEVERLHEIAAIANDPDYRDDEARCNAIRAALTEAPRHG